MTINNLFIVDTHKKNAGLVSRSITYNKQKNLPYTMTTTTKAAAGPILITGGAGYIGSVLINELIKNTSNKITVVDKLIFEQNSLNSYNN